MISFSGTLLNCAIHAWAAIRCSPPQSVEAPSGECLRGKGRHGVPCRLKLCDPCLSALKWFVYYARRYTSALLYLYQFVCRCLILLRSTIVGGHDPFGHKFWPKVNLWFGLEWHFIDNNVSKVWRRQVIQALPTKKLQSLWSQFCWLPLIIGRLQNHMFLASFCVFFYFLPDITQGEVFMWGSLILDKAVQISLIFVKAWFSWRFMNVVYYNDNIAV